MANEQPKKALDVLAQFIEQKEVLIQALDRLYKMRGKTDSGIPKCNNIKFCSNYSAELHVYELDPDFNVAMVDAAIKYYTDKLKNVNFLLGLAERVVSKEIGKFLGLQAPTAEDTNDNTV